MDENSGFVDSGVVKTCDELVTGGGKGSGIERCQISASKHPVCIIHGAN